VVRRACIQWNKEKGSTEGRLVYRKLPDKNSRVWKV
jgi:hypothetical protein